MLSGTAQEKSCTEASLNPPASPFQTEMTENLSNLRKGYRLNFLISAVISVFVPIDEI